jgi:hypothetical protein
MLGERELLGTGDEHGGRDIPPLAEAAAALVAAGTVDETVARRLVAEYGVARGLRNGYYQHVELSLRPSPRPSMPEALPPIAPRRLVVLDHSMELPWGALTLRYALLSEDSTQIAVRMRFNDPGALQYGASGSMPTLAVTDRDGATTATMGGGGGGGGGWQAQYWTDRPLVTDSTWLEFEGERVELDHPTPDVSVRIEERTDGSPIWRYLWHTLATGDHFTGRDVAAATGALLAAGVLADDDPQLAHLLAAADPSLLHGHAPSSATSSLPEPWRSLGQSRGHRRRRDASTKTLAVGAVTPVFGGVSVAINALELSSDGGFTAVVEVEPDHGHHAPWSNDLPETGLAWWAADDRGNHFLGHTGNWSGGDGRGHGAIAFPGSLDPDAKRLDVMPTLLDVRAVISVALDALPTDGTPA